MWLLNPYRFAAAYTPTDANAAAYIAAVEAADGQTLEAGVRQAIDTFVIGCKSDGIWTAIKASCIMAGARTLAGALVPLVGTAPTRFGTEAGWNYNRKTGLQGNGTDNYLNSNRADNADPTDSAHSAVFVSQPSTGGAGSTQTYLGGGTVIGSASLRAIIRLNQAGAQLFTGLSQYNRTGNFNGNINENSTGFFGNSRAISASFTRRDLSSTATVNQASVPTNNTTIAVFTERRDGVVLGRYADCRLAFYSIGESLNLALLDARVTTLINAIAAAIP